jgi:trehalose-6-phosphate synthase
MPRAVRCRESQSSDQPDGGSSSGEGALTSPPLTGGADIYIVSSLQDGRNLVAKEFVAAQVDEQGMLILSQFTGAATELPDELIINPYNIDQCAAALHLALILSPTEQRIRMHRIVQEFNVYRWVWRTLMDAVRMRQQARLVRQMGERDARNTTGGQP